MTKCGVPTKNRLEAVQLAGREDQRGTRKGKCLASIKDFCANVIIQTTADEDYALKLGSINSIELGVATYEMMPYIKPLPGTVVESWTVLTACTTQKPLAGLLAPNNCGILYTRMLGKSTSAAITFEGPHVPFYEVASSSVQYCKTCGEIGHRQDVYPNPGKHICNRCGVQNPAADHDCQLQSKVCGLPQETASKECGKRLKPRPPPLYVRERSKSRGRQPSITRDTRASSSEYETNKPQQEQQKISWAAVIASSKSKTNPFPSLPTQEGNCRYEETISSLKRLNPDLMKRNQGLMKRLEEQERREEERDRRAQAREQALVKKLQQLIDQLQKQHEPTTTPTPPTEHTAPIEDLESGIEYKMNKARTNDKAELRNELQAELAQAVDTISKSVAATVEAAVQMLRQEITQVGVGCNLPKEGPRTAVLIKKHQATQQHQINHRIKHTFIELFPYKKTLQSLYILSVYSPPRDTLKDLAKFVR
ncbi:hypothetical protein HPB49_024982 [Dermacentor silvarum]|uniref:Uncharacterized protein n=1 Tax=Dermacentor silvarum TaxID=543639 RepID=A0ACB8CCB6_DERSI|nr:hypothetical protein HPB49_024982 [Dermacentor silvarum]